jgi:antitoxin component YwqK of YwqJK toxin-antitoxin module
VVQSGSYDQGYSAGEWLFYFDKDWVLADKKASAEYFRKINFTNEKGPWSATDYYINGEKQFEGMLGQQNPDLPVGKCTYYYKNGRVSQEMELELTGVFKSAKTYNEQGILEKQVTATGPEYNRQINAIEYHPNGTVKAKGKVTEDGSKTGNWELFDINGARTVQNY